MTGAGSITINHIGISVSDMARTLALFRDVLEAAVTQPQFFDNQGVADSTGIPGAKVNIAYATLGDMKFELIEYAGPDGRRSSDLLPCDAGQIHIALSVDDLHGMVGKLGNAGFTARGVVPPLGTKPRGGLYLYGFDGLVIELKTV